jgi:hypothetical protein
LGQIPAIASAQRAQNVHSNVQIRASEDDGGNGIAHFSHADFSSSAIISSR